MPAKQSRIFVGTLYSLSEGGGGAIAFIVISAPDPKLMGSGYQMVVTPTVMVRIYIEVLPL